MTTKKLLTALVMIMAVTSFAQRVTGNEKDNGDVVFDDGRVINFKMLENDPSVRVDWTVMGSFRPTYFDGYLAMTLGLNASANLWGIADLYGESRGGLHIDFDMPGDVPYKSLKKQYQYHKLEGSFKFYQKESIKKTLILLDETTAGYVTTSYMVGGKLKYRSSYGIIAGVEYTQRRVKSDGFEGAVIDTNENGLDNYYYTPLTLYQTNLRLGLDITWITSSLVEIDGVRRVDYQHARLYSIVLVPVSHRLDVAKYSDHLTGRNTATLVDESQYTGPGFSNLGFLMGGEILNEFEKSGGYFGISLEVGLLPGVKHENTFDSFTASLGLQIGFGSNLTKSWDKR